MLEPRLSAIVWAYVWVWGPLVALRCELRPAVLVLGCGHLVEAVFQSKTGHCLCQTVVTGWELQSKLRTVTICAGLGAT